MKNNIVGFSIYLALSGSFYAHAENSDTLHNTIISLQKKNLHHKALELALIAAKTGNPEAQLWVGDLHRLGGPHLKADLNEARSWYLRAYHNGNPAAAQQLGMMALNGEGESKDINKAQEWFAQSFLMGNPEAELDYYKLASPALAYAMELAQRGEVQAQTILGLAYYHGGSGIPIDHEKARMWFAKAAAQGNAIAQNYLQTSSD